MHFVVIGMVLFGFDAWLRGPRQPAEPGTSPESIVIRTERIEQIRSDYTRATGLALTAEDEAALIEREVEDEILYQEALARGLDRYDRSVRYRLIQKMGFLSDDPARQKQDLHREALELGLDRDDAVVRRILIRKMRLLAKIPAGRDEPSEADLQEYFVRHLDEYLQPPQITLSHVFLSRQERGENLRRDAQKLLAKLRSRAAPMGRPQDLGDPFPLGHQVRSASSRHLQKRYGASFAEEVMTLEPGFWSGPVRSAYGLHLVWVESKEPSREPSLASVRTQISRRLREERKEQASREFLRHLREVYTVRIERPARSGV
jgi:hypothetical protein